MQIYRKLLAEMGYAVMYRNEDGGTTIHLDSTSPGMG